MKNPRNPKEIQGFRPGFTGTIPSPIILVKSPLFVVQARQGGVGRTGLERRARCCTAVQLREGIRFIPEQDPLPTVDGVCAVSLLPGKGHPGLGGPLSVSWLPRWAAGRWCPVRSTAR